MDGIMFILQPHVCHISDFQMLSVGTHLEVFPSKELDPHDGEDEPEDEADQQNVEDAWDCLDESVDHNLRFEHP